MNILVNGSSISRGPEAWPYRLQELIGCDIVNLALAGSGYTYVFETTVTEISKRQYDQVLIMWPESGRIDLRVKDPTKFKDSISTSLHQVDRNTWPGKRIDPVDDRDYVQRDWIFSYGIRPEIRPPSDSADRLLQPIYYATDHALILESELIKIIALQSILKNKNIPYLFMFWQPFKRFDRFESYYDMIDWANVYTDDYLHSIVHRHKMEDPTDLHPKQAAHQIFAEQIVKRIQ